MLQHFTGEARTVVIDAQEHARRLGHRFVGCEHLLLAASESAAPVGAVLRAQGLTGDRIEEQIVRLAGRGAGPGLFADLDRDALASIGIDVDAVRARIETAFGPDALTRAAYRERRRRRRLGRPRRTGRSVSAADTTPGGHLPLTPRAKKVLADGVREAQAARESRYGAEHIALALVATTTDLVPSLLTALGATGPVVRAAILEQYRRAG